MIAVSQVYTRTNIRTLRVARLRGEDFLALWRPAKGSPTLAWPHCVPVSLPSI